MEAKEMSTTLKVSFYVTYSHEDFAIAGYDSIAYFDDDEELVVVRDFTAHDCAELWKENSDGWDGELLGISV